MMVQIENGQYSPIFSLCVCVLDAIAAASAVVVDGDTRIDFICKQRAY